MKKLKNLKITRLFLGAIALTIIVSSCKKDIDSGEIEVSDYEVVFNEALFVANEFVIESNSNLKGKEIKKLVGSHEMKRANGKKGIYIFNYSKGEEKEWVIVGGDKRVPAVLAFGSGENFELDNYNDGVQYYINSTLNGFDQLDLVAQKKSASSSLHESWMGPMNRIEDPDAGGSGCTGTVTKGPIQKSTWSQSGYYNDKVTKSCGADQAPVGCFAVALGQILYANEYPSGYSYSSMAKYLASSSSSSSKNAVSQLLFDCAEAANTTYSCNGSWVEPIGSAIESTIQDLGYPSHVTYDNFSDCKSDVKLDLQYNHPVLVFAAESVVSGWHYWMLEGYQNRCGVIYYYCNWGWGGTYNNWYLSTFQLPNGDSYNHFQHAVYNIHQ